MPVSTSSRSNGRGVKPLDILRLGDTIEEKRPVEVNGRQLWAWVTLNGRYPSSVAAELDDARNRWMATRHPVDPEAVTPQQLWLTAADLATFLDAVPAEESPDAEDVLRHARAIADAAKALAAQPEVRSSEVDWQTYLTESLCILIPGLEYHEADLMMPEQRLLALYELGYMRPPVAAGAATEEGGEPQAPPEPSPEESSTGDVPEPVSAASTE